MKEHYFWRDPFSFILIGGVIFFCFSWIVPSGRPDPTPILQEIQNDYERGKETASIDQRKTIFNRSLQSLLRLEKDYAPTHGNGNLYLHIGDSYARLEDYPHAILYYYRALALNPRNVTTLSHLDVAADELQIKIQPQTSLFSYLFFWHYQLSTPQRLQLFLALGTLTLGFASAEIWFQRGWLRRFSLPLLFCSGLLLISLTFSYYFTPMQAVMINASLLYRDAGKQYATVMDLPIPPGLKVQLMDVVQDGKWLKVRTADGVVGYLPYESLKIV